MFSYLLHTEISPSLSVSCGEALVRRLWLQSLLRFHSGCVNTASFYKGDGDDRLISGSDDYQIAIWDWQEGTRVASFASGHYGNVFQAKNLDGAGSGKLVSSGADGQVLLHEICEGCSGVLRSKNLYQHSGRAHKLAVSPTNSNVLLSVGEDGKVMLYDIREFERDAVRCVLVQSQQSQRRESLYSVHMNPIRPEQFCIGGTSGIVRIFDIRAPILSAKAQSICQLLPQELLQSPAGMTSVTSCVFSKDGSLLSSLNDDDIYLYDSSSILRASGVVSSEQRFSSDPATEFARANSNFQQGMKKRSKGWYLSVPASVSLGGNKSSLRLSGYHMVMFPEDVSVTASGQIEMSTGSRDNDNVDDSTSLSESSNEGEDEISTSSGETSESNLDSSSSDTEDSSMDGVEGGTTDENDNDVSSWYDSEDETYEFNANLSIGHGEDPWSVMGMCSVFRGHRNEATVKGATFLGADEEFIVSGSDCGYIYVWNRKLGSLVTTFKGDDCVVNCLEPHPYRPYTLATCGIEHDVKIWAPIAEEPLALTPRDIDRANYNQRGKSKTEIELYFSDSGMSD